MNYKEILNERKSKVEQLDRDCDALLEKEHFNDIVKDVKYHLYKIKKGEPSNYPNHPGCMGYYVSEMSYGLGEKIAKVLTEDLGTRVVAYNEEIDKWPPDADTRFSGRYFDNECERGVLFQMIDKLPDFEFSKEELLEIEAHQRIFG